MLEKYRTLRFTDAQSSNAAANWFDETVWCEVDEKRANRDRDKFNDDFVLAEGRGQRDERIHEYWEPMNYEFRAHIPLM